MQAAGFVKGRPVALHVLDYGLFRVHANRRVIGICGFLIRTDADENIIVDTGFPQKYARDSKAATDEDRLYEFGEVLECTPENMPMAQLAKLGLTYKDITLHIVSHTHIDHIGGIADFAHVPILISDKERALPRPLYWSDVQPIEWPDQEYIVTEGDIDLGPGMKILFAPGHAPGQLALLVTLPESGPVLLTSDAISRPAEIDERFAGSWNEELARASAAQLLRIAEEEGAFVIYGHSPEQWPELKKAPEGYF